MTPEQTEAFSYGGGGGSFTVENLYTAIVSVSVAVLIMLIAWLFYKAYTEFGRSNIKASTMVTIWIRGLFILMFGLFIFTS